MEKILVAVDSSGYSDKVLAKTKELGTVFNSEVTIMHVMPSVNYHPYTSIHSGDLTMHIEPLEDGFQKEGMKLLDAARGKLKDYPHKVDTLLAKGNPGSEIIREANKGGYTLLIIGSRGLGSVTRVMLGSVSNKVVNNVNLSVLVVK